MLPSHFSRRISVVDGSLRASLPDWAASLVWLGGWCRSNRVAGKRLIAFVVLPAREFAAAFLGLGCLLAGARQYEDSLSWPKFKALEVGRRVFWSRRDGTTRYQGSLLGAAECGGAEFIAVEVTKAPRRAEIGTRLMINRKYFDDYRFTEEEPPTRPRALSLNAAGQSLACLVENFNPKWIWTDGAEGLVVTSVATFETSMTSLAISVDGRPPIGMSDILCSDRNNSQGHAKLRIDHPRGALAGHFPLVILDGPGAFAVHEHLSTASNVLVVLDRSEYREDIHNAALGVRSISSEGLNAVLANSMPNTFSRGIEIAAYRIDDK